MFLTHPQQNKITENSIKVPIQTKNKKKGRMGLDCPQRMRTHYTIFNPHKASHASDE